MAWYRPALSPPYPAGGTIHLCTSNHLQPFNFVYGAVHIGIGRHRSALRYLIESKARGDWHWCDISYNLRSVASGIV